MPEERCRVRSLAYLQRTLDHVWRSVDGCRLVDRGGHHGLPWARSAITIAGYTLLPFGQKVVPRAAVTGRDDIGTGPPGMIGNLIWMVFAGWWLALAHVVTAFFLAITIIGIPFALGASQACPARIVADRPSGRADLRGCEATWAEARESS
jgi:uncharacterized membrane protein YccF (DUF307 family)